MSIENFGIYGSSERSTPTNPLRLLYNVSISADVRSLKKIQRKHDSVRENGKEQQKQSIQDDGS